MALLSLLPFSGLADEHFPLPCEIYQPEYKVCIDIILLIFWEFVTSWLFSLLLSFPFFVFVFVFFTGRDCQEAECYLCTSHSFPVPRGKAVGFRHWARRCCFSGFAEGGLWNWLFAFVGLLVFVLHISKVQCSYSNFYTLLTFSGK